MPGRKAATPVWPNSPVLPMAQVRRKKSGLLSLVALALTAVLTPVAHARDSNHELSQKLLQIRAQDQRMQNIGWKLVSANASYCEQTVPSIGLQLVDVAGYRKPAQIREALGLSSELAIYTIAAGSPASHAQLPLMAEVLAVDGKPLTDIPAKTHSDWERLASVHDAVEQSLLVDGSVGLELADGQTHTVEGTAVCASRFELGGKNKQALADGSRVILGRNFPGFAYADDELAAALAHELAHNILGHKQWLDKQGRKRKATRLTEREADRLMPWLLVNAGYDPAAAIRFMQKWGPKHGGGLLRKRTHDGWDERVDFITSEIARLNAVQNDGGTANWSTHFQREIP